MKKLLFPLVFLLLLSVFGCQKAAEPQDEGESVEFYAMDTYCRVTVFGDATADFETLSRQAASEAEQLLTTASRKNTYISETPNQVLNLSERATEVIKKAYEVYDLSGGLFDISVAPLTTLWNVSERTVPPTDSELTYALSCSGKDKMIFTENLHTMIFPTIGAGIDIGGIGKGYAGNVAAKALSEAGFSGGIISFGGNVTVFGKKSGDKPFSVGIKDPASEKSDAIIGTVSAENCSVITSGAYERYFIYEGKRYHHIIDPRTGSPAQSDLLSVTVVTTDGVYGDALSTAAFIDGSEGAVRLLREAVRRGMISGGVIVSNKKQVQTVGDIKFILTSGDYYEN